ncbi:unnamed protein product [Owenia fusiformis]|uniref:Ankyrin repeat protein n=1 Tax=Owenia fusiformis TaxID=6347 RepID=A0A8S4NMD8_OWEFU|nr:unnamed protein product [Owenia fusiformis]
MGNSLEKHIKVQLDQGVKVEDLKRIPEDKKPLLQWAIRTNNTNVIETLLEYGVILNCVWSDSNGDLTTPLMCCIQFKRWDILHLLIKCGADPNFTTHTDTSDVLSDNFKNEAIEKKVKIFETPLNVLIKTTDAPSMVMEFINTGAKVNTREQDIVTPLMTAVLLNKSNIVSALLNKGADPNQKSYNPKVLGLDIPLNVAIKNTKDLSIIEELIAHRVDVNAKGWNEDCPLTVAFNHNKDLIPILIQHGADPESTVQNGNTLLQALLHAGIQNKDTYDLIRRVIELGAMVNNPGTSGETPLAVAIAKKNTCIIEVLLKNKADPNQLSYNPKFSTQQTPLDTIINMATKWSYDEFGILKILLANGASVNRAGQGGDTPLIKALKRENTAIVEELIKQGANVNENDSSGTVLFHAIQNNVHMVRPLLKSGANPNQKSGRDTPLTALIKTAYHSDVTTEVRMYAKYVIDLIEYGADVNTPDSSGCTPLMLTIYNKNSILRNVLLERGADPNLVGYNSRLPGNDTPLNAILRDIGNNDADDMARTIIQHGANPNAIDPRGYTPLDLVIIWGLRASSKQGYIRVTLLLIQAGADINMKYGENKDITVLMFLILMHEQYSPNEAIEYLVEHGADVNEVSSTSNDVYQATYTTPLDLAMKKNYTKIVEILLQHKAGEPAYYHVNTLAYFTKRSIRNALAKSKAFNAGNAGGTLLTYREKMDLLPLPSALKKEI